MSTKGLSCLLFTIFGVLVYINAINADSINQVGWENVYGNNISSILPLYHYGDKSYFMGVHYRLNYLQAHQFCQSIHMNLLSITSNEENDRIYKYIRDANKGDEYWSSGSRLLDGKDWVWMSNGEVVDYTQWADGQPNTNHEMCLQLWHIRNKGLYWQDRDCNTQLLFICDRKSGSNDNSANPTQLGYTNLFQHSSLSTNINLLHFNNKSYYISRNYRGRFLEAVQFCKMIQMQLVTITSEPENSRLHKYIRDTFAGDNFWSSGARFLDGKSWTWISTGVPVEYTNWLQGQPDNQNDHCIHLIDQRNNGLFWNDANCESQWPFICEKSSKTSCEIGGYCNNGGSNYGNRGNGIDVRVESKDNNNNFGANGQNGFVGNSRNNFAANGQNGFVGNSGNNFAANGQNGFVGNSGNAGNVDGDFDTDNEWINSLKATLPGSATITHIEGKKFHLENQFKATQSQAAQYCQYHQMKLVEITSEEKTRILDNLLAESTVSGPYWTAGIRSTGGTWTWPSTDQVLTYTNWRIRQPSIRSRNNCIEIDDYVKWTNQVCDAKRYFICESKPAQSKPSQNNFQCSSQPIVNVYIHNNLLTDEDNVVGPENYVTSRNVTESSEGGYYVQVTNNIDATSKESKSGRTTQKTQKSSFKSFYLEDE